MGKNKKQQSRKDGKYQGNTIAESGRNRDNFEPDWTEQCEVCGSSPVVPVTGMCGPCTFGEADTAGGNW